MRWMLLVSITILRGIRKYETLREGAQRRFWTN